MILDFFLYIKRRKFCSRWTTHWRTHPYPIAV